MQENRSLLNKLEIVSPNCHKNITFNFNSDQSKPLQLISWNETQGFSVNPEAQKFFDSLRDNNLGVISIVGKNRTGKSYLMNRVVLNQSHGFSVGHTINPCTKGIWVWPHIIEIENKNNETEKLNVIVMDTEGTDATDQQDNYDTKIFMLGMLLSSCLIYNSVGAIDEKAIQNLSLIINLSKHLQKANEKEFEDLMECFPSFLWVVRDFALKLIDPQGTPITPKEYLENSLKPQKGFSEAVESKNRIRRLLSNFFKDRDCFMMVRPMEGEKDIQSLHKQKPENLRPEFNEQVNTLRRKIWLKVKPKLFRGKPVNGPAFIVLSKLLCKMMNTGEELNLESNWNSICKVECEKIVRELTEKYDQQMHNDLSKGKITQQAIVDMHKRNKSEVLETFKKRALGDNIKEFEAILEDTLKQRYQTLKKSCNDKIESGVRQFVDERLEEFESKIENKEFSTYTDLVIEFKNIKLDLEEEFKDSESRSFLLDALLQKFMKAAESFQDDINASLKQNDRFYQVEIDSLKSKITSLENKHESKVMENMEAVKTFEAERAKLKAEVSSLLQKISQIEQQKSEESGKINSKIAEVKQEYKAKEEDFMSKIRDLQQQLEEIKKEKEALATEKEGLLTEREGLVLESERKLEYKGEQIDCLNRTLSELKKELKHERQSHKASMHAVEEIKKMMTLSPMNQRKKKEGHEGGEERRDSQNRAFDEILKENQELKKNIDVLNGRIESNVDEFYLQRNELEAKMEEIERHYKEKQLQDEFAIATFKKRIRNYENADLAMLETNKNLSIALERADTRCFNLEKKADKLKKYHKIFKYADDVTCKFCTKRIKKNLFIAHIEICNLNDDRNYDEQHTSRLSPNFTVTFENQLQNTHIPNNRAFKIEGNIGKQKCYVTKSFQDVREFIHSMKTQLKNSEILPYLEELLKLNSDRLSEENWASTKELLQEIMISLAKIPHVRESSAFQDFLPFNARGELSNLSNISIHPEDILGTSRMEEGKPYDNHDLNMKNKHLRKESNRYFSGKESFISNLTNGNGYRGKKTVGMNPDIGLKESVFYDNFEA